MKGRFYIYVPTNKKYNYPKVDGLLYNTQEKRFSFLVDIDESGKAIGETSGKAIRDFQSLNPGVSIVKVETKKISSSTPIVTTPVKDQVKPVIPKEEDSSSGALIIAGLVIVASLFF